MEPEIDLGPLFRAVARRWALILRLVALSVLIACVVALAIPRPYTAQANLFIFPKKPELTLDTRFTERESSLLTNQAQQRQALIDIGDSPVLATRVIGQQGLATDEPDELLDNIRVRANSDLIEVIASAPTREEATALAEAWATEYQSLVGELYSGAAPQLAQIENDLRDSQQQFGVIQAELDAFYARGDLVRAQQEVERLKGLFQGGVEAQVNLYTQHLSRTQELNLILEDARSLQAQLEAGAQADFGATLGALAVRARLAGADELPVQLTFDNAESFAESQASTADLARFVTILEVERDRMVARADTLAADLAVGNTAAVGLPLEARRRYETALAAAQGTLARAQGEESLLIQRRNLSLTSLQVLQSRADELRIDQGQSQVTLRFIGVAPQQPRSLLITMLLAATVGAVVGALLGILVVIVLELRRRSRDVVSPQPGKGPSEHVGSTTASD